MKSVCFWGGFFVWFLLVSGQPRVGHGRRVHVRVLWGPLEALAHVGLGGFPGREDVLGDWHAHGLVVGELSAGSGDLFGRDVHPENGGHAFQVAGEERRAQLLLARLDRAFGELLDQLACKGL